MMESIIITGAGSGLGKELALLLAAKGFHILLAGRSAEKLTTVKNIIATNGGQADIVVMDVTNKSIVSEKITELYNNFHISCLVNNAGVGFFGKFTKMTSTEIEAMFNTNVYGTFHTTQLLLPYFEKQQSGKIVNIISTAGLRGKKNEAVYAASKFAVRGFTESLQKEYEDSPIEFTAVYMGGMDTPFWDESDHIADRSRLRSPKEVAELILEKWDEEAIVIESLK